MTLCKSGTLFPRGLVTHLAHQQHLSATQHNSSQPSTAKLSHHPVHLNIRQVHCQLPEVIPPPSNIHTFQHPHPKVRAPHPKWWAPHQTQLNLPTLPNFNYHDLHGDNSLYSISDLILSQMHSTVHHQQCQLSQFNNWFPFHTCYKLVVTSCCDEPPVIASHILCTVDNIMKHW
jgi:hypothetical protein